MELKAAILAIGTELTSGETLNTNGAWLGEKLEEFGFSVHSQMMVPDNRQIMEQALTWFSTKVQLILVTGGLGPTSDDFTRDVIAAWSGQSLEFNENIWKQMNDLYKERGLLIRPAHRQQCYFPHSSQILHNPVGSAHGFALSAKGVKLVVLPGPPYEIHGMWPQQVAPELISMSPQKELTLKVWTCLGATESEVAEITEKVIENSGFLVGYRATVPYVKVKLWLPNTPRAAEVCDQLEKALHPWVVAYDRDDPLDFFKGYLARFSKVSILDQITQGRLAVRLQTKDWPDHLSLLTEKQEDPPNTRTNEKQDHLALWIKAAADAQTFEIGWRLGAEEKSEKKKLPFKLVINSKRGALYATEMAVQWWLQELKGLSFAV